MDLNKPQSAKSAIPPLSVVNAALAASPKPLQFQLAMMAFTGMRVGEAQHLLVEDVRFEQGWIHIESRPGFETKNGQSRKVPMHWRLKEVLLGMPQSRDGWLFRAPRSNRYPREDHHLNPRNVNEDFKSVLDAQGQPVGRDGGYTLQSLRRFFVTTSINSGVPDRVVKAWVGHADEKDVTARYYHLSDEESQTFMKQVRFNQD